MAAEEKDLQSDKTDASLYNGQPTGTGTQCHRVGVASGTPSIQQRVIVELFTGCLVATAYIPREAMEISIRL